MLGLTLSSLGFWSSRSLGEGGGRGWFNSPYITFLLFINNMWKLGQLISGLSSTELWYQFVIRACDVMMTLLHSIFLSILINLRLLPMKSKGNHLTRIYFNPRSLEGGGGQFDPPLDFLALNFCSLTDCQKLWHNCYLFVNTSFDTN